MLALESGRTVSTDHLAEGLWGDEPPPSGAKMVQLYVSRLRRLLDGDGVRIVTRGRGYELQLLDGEVDATRVERLLGESRAREALALWRGEPLADLADEPFAAASIRRLEELRLRATEMAIDADLEAGRHGELIGELEALVSANPLSERLHAQRMLALYHAGRQSEALDAYRAARATLVEEIGVEPGADLRRLHEAILTQDPELDLPAPAVPAAALRPLPRRRSRAVLAGAAAILLAGVTAFGVIRLVEPDSLPGIDEDHVGVIDPDGGGISAEYAVGRAPGAIAAGAGSLWVANRLDGTVSRIDRGRDEVVTIPVGGAPSAVAFGAGSLWVADGDARSVAQVDPGANKVQQRIPVGNAPRSLAVGAGALWVASGVDGRVQRIDLDRARVSRSIQIGANPTALVVGAGALWVASEEAGTVTRIEPRTGRVVGALNVGNGPTALAAGEGAIWVVNRRDGLLSRIDPARNAVAWADRVGQDPIGVAVGAGSVWVAGGNDGTVIRADPRRPGAVDRIQTGSGPAAIAVADGSVWTSALAPEAAHRGGTLRVVMSNGVGINWLNPNVYDWSTAMIPLAYDGLVAYRRVDGAAGATLVGALATTVPAPSADGRTYVFTLRPGLRYSDGRPVRPEDFRASMERLLRVKDAPPLYAGIVGAPRCMRRPARCDLSRGIETDPVARTIAVHLREPDSDFLHKLTLVFAAVVPADSSASRSPGLAPPGTGPYRVAAWDARARWGARAQPALPLERGSAGGVRRSHRGRASGAGPRRASPPCSRAPRICSSSRTSSRLPSPASASRARRPGAGARAQRPGADHGVDVAQRHAAPVRRPARAAGAEPRDRPRCARQDRRRGRRGRPRLSGPAARVPGIPAVLPVQREPRPGSRLDRAGSGAGTQPRGGLRHPGGSRRRARAGVRARGRELLRAAAGRPRLPRAPASGCGRLLRARVRRGPARADGLRRLGGGLHQPVDVHRGAVHVLRAR